MVVYLRRLLPPELILRKNIMPDNVAVIPLANIKGVS
jgi:hypothetical protein